MKPVDDLDIGLEETVPAGIAVERMFDQTLDSLDVYTENFSRLLGLLLLFHASGPTKILRLQGVMDLRAAGRLFTWQQCGHDSLEELGRIRAPAGEMQEGMRIKVIGESLEFELLPHEAGHPREGRADRVRSGHSLVGVQQIWQAPPNPMRLAFHTRNSVPHRKQDRAPGQIAGQQEKPIIPQIQGKPSLHQLGSELGSRYHRHRAPIGRFLHRPDRRPVQW